MELSQSIVVSACSCGELVLIEHGRNLCRTDGKRPHYSYSSHNTTVFRCRRCHGFLADTCKAAAFEDKQKGGAA